MTHFEARNLNDFQTSEYCSFTGNPNADDEGRASVLEMVTVQQQQPPPPDSINEFDPAIPTLLLFLLLLDPFQSTHSAAVRDDDDDDLAKLSDTMAQFA